MFQHHIDCPCTTKVQEIQEIHSGKATDALTESLDTKEHQGEILLWH